MGKGIKTGDGIDEDEIILQSLYIQSLGYPYMQRPGSLSIQPKFSLRPAITGFN